MKDTRSYLSLMEKALQEKLWFTNKVDINEYDLVIDFGCANGVLLDTLYQDSNAYGPIFMGYEINTELFKDRDPDYPPIITNNWDTIISAISTHGKSLILFSSVLHEVKYEELMAKLEDLILAGITTICIRDMYTYAPLFTEPLISKHYAIKHYPESKPYAKKYLGFFKNDFKNSMQYLLKYPYIKNMSTEIEEDYFSTPWIDIKDVCLRAGLFNRFELDYTNIFIKNRIKKDFDIEINYPTHRLLILSRDQQSLFSRKMPKNKDIIKTPVAVSSVTINL